MLCLACEVPQGPLGEDEGEDDRAALTSAGAVRMIHVGGICSTDWVSGKKLGGAPSAGGEPSPPESGNTRLAQLEGVESVNAFVDQRTSMTTAVSDLRDELDRSCTGDDWCYLHGYSNGGAVISRTMATHADDRWNILWVLHTASNEGGSELSGGTLASLGATLGLSCELAKRISPTDHRGAWNHDDTAGAMVYLVGGRREWWYTGSAPDFFGGDVNDGAVAAHSSAGLNDTYAVSDDEPWMCFDPKYHFTNHQTAYDCEGVDRDHYAMAMQGIAELGG
jgi:hypothetical protein